MQFVDQDPYRGLAYYDKGNYERAIADYNEAILLDPKDARAFSYRGLAYSKKGDYNRAIADYNETIRLNPQYDGAIRTLRDQAEAALRDNKP